MGYDPSNYHKETNIKVKCENPEYGKLFPLRIGDHPRWTKWCPPCRTSMTKKDRACHWLGG
uniref:Uncharacterized protein n=1 Tax=viral metagenome TaxID=1070528 RepID=A0A6M3K778_9ZZZZ